MMRFTKQQIEAEARACRVAYLKNPKCPCCGSPITSVVPDHHTIPRSPGRWIVVKHEPGGWSCLLAQLAVEKEARQKAEAITAQANDDALALRIAADCHDPQHDPRHCPTCDARLGGIEDYREIIRGGKDLVALAHKAMEMEPNTGTQP